MHPPLCAMTILTNCLPRLPIVSPLFATIRYPFDVYRPSRRLAKIVSGASRGNRRTRSAVRIKHGRMPLPSPVPVALDEAFATDAGNVSGIDRGSMLSAQ
jgi:hypothetical protein